MSSALIERLSLLVERHLDRRGFLSSSAVAASAVVAAPRRFLLEPNSAYAAICGCRGDCPCGSACCDGYTEFCCAMFGPNECPPNTLVAGWWKADGSGFCDHGGDARPRYYMDCNADCNGCGCGSSGVCALSCVDCGCGCAKGSCANRAACCTRFRYGQCSQNVKCVGAIVCRVVTCTPPWLFDPSCTRTVATDNVTRTHNRGCLTGTKRSLLARKRPGSNQWTLLDALSGTGARFSIGFGTPDDMPVMGDWNGDGQKTPGIVRDGRFWFLRSSMTSGPADIVFQYGKPGDTPVVGDWNGDGFDGPGVVRGNTWHLKNRVGPGPADVSFGYGRQGDSPIVGDWNGDGRTSVGVYRGDRFMLRNSNTSGPAQLDFAYGDPDDVPVVGDWSGRGVDGIGVVRGSQWLLRFRASGGPAQLSVDFGPADEIPVVWGRS